MITFFPKEDPMWADAFDFHPPITLVPKEKTYYKAFYNQGELIQFLKAHGVSLSDPHDPLRFEEQPDRTAHGRGYLPSGGFYTIRQQQVIGWMIDDYK